ncbi:MAG: Ig-like domain-containing protein, partial [Candidatus Rokuibacteriota bacterium]
MNNSTGVAVNATLLVVFDQAMNSSATAGAFSISPPVTAGAVSVAGTNLTFSHPYDLVPYTNYRVNISTAARNLGGENLSANFTFSFTTGAAPPVVVSTDPVAGATGVPLSQPVIVRFSLPMNVSATASSFGILPAIAGNASVLNDTLTFSHTAVLAANTTYTVDVSTAARSIYGDNLAADFTFNFTTARAPVVLSTLPADGAVAVSVIAPVLVVFDQAMSPVSTASAFSISPVVNGTAVVAGPNLTWTHLTPFAPSTLYTVTVSTGATSTAGVRLAANFTFNFTTAALPVKSIAITDPPGFA